MITFSCMSHSFAYELECVTRLFMPGVKLVQSGEQPAPGEHYILTKVEVDGEQLCLSAGLHLERPACQSSAEDFLPVNIQDEVVERRLALLLYHLLSQATGERPPWGILTGVRPVRLCRQWSERGMSQEEIRERLVRDYLVQPQKVDLALDTGRVQEPFLTGSNPRRFSLYIGIPFCPTRCLYCSFVSADIQKMTGLVPQYVELLCREIREIGGISAQKGMELHTVYMGGGTPTSLEPGQLAAVLQAVADSFDLSHLTEYTVEAGRADTITGEKLEVLRKFDIGRISINPQTMEDTILETIGRGHTARQVLDSFALAREMGFSAINMDLIAGLPGETAESFGRTLDTVLALGPENLTLHTLTVKRSSGLRDREDAFSGSSLPLDQLLETAQKRFAREGYRPYYLYRQKGTVQNLENTGFTLPGFEGIYNILSMEETHTLLAAGAGGVTKLCRRGGDIQRVYNYKYPLEYIRGFDQILARKNAVREWELE